VLSLPIKRGRARAVQAESKVPSHVTERPMYSLVQPAILVMLPARRTNMTRLDQSQEHSPVVVAHQAQRATEFQLRIADKITAFAAR
jgi:hypothetical protein